MHFLYNYSLEFLLEIFTYVLKSSDLEGVKDYDKRLSIITSNLFKVVFLISLLGWRRLILFAIQVCYSRISHGMLHADKVLLAILLLRIYLRSNGRGMPTYEEQFDHLLLRADLAMSKGLQSQASKLDIKPLDQSQVTSLLSLSRLPEFKQCVEKVRHMDGLANWIKSDVPELSVPELWEEQNISKSWALRLFGECTVSPFIFRSDQEGHKRGSGGPCLASRPSSRFCTRPGFGCLWNRVYGSRQGRQSEGNSRGSSE